MSRYHAFVAALAVFVVLLGSTRAHTQYVAPFNHVVVVLDSSISFQKPVGQPGATGRIPVVEALAIVQKLFAASSAQKRRRNSGVDRYEIVAADAASQVIWSGSREDLAKLTPEVLLAMLKVRRQFSQCTDYKTALNAAARSLREHGDATNMYVLVFGDLIHEPTTSSYRTCAAPSGAPPDGIDWDTLGAAALGFYFVSTDFNLRPNQRYRELLEARGLEADFKDAAQALTQAIDLPPLPVAVYRPTEEQTAEAATRWADLKATAWTATKIIAGTLLIGAVGLVAFISLAKRRAGTVRVRQGGQNG